MEETKTVTIVSTGSNTQEPEYGYDINTRIAYMKCPICRKWVQQPNIV